MEQPSLTYINELSGGDEAFKEKLIAVVKSELPQEIDEYQGNMSKSAFAKAAENVHKIKHKLGILSLEKSYEFAITYEDQLLEGNADLQVQFNEILERCVDFINKI